MNSSGKGEAPATAEKLGARKMAEEFRVGADTKFTIRDRYTQIHSEVAAKYFGVSRSALYALAMRRLLQREVEKPENKPLKDFFEQERLWPLPNERVIAQSVRPPSKGGQKMASNTFPAGSYILGNPEMTEVKGKRITSRRYHQAEVARTRTTPTSIDEYNEIAAAAVEAAGLENKGNASVELKYELRDKLCFLYDADGNDISEEHAYIEDRATRHPDYVPPVRKSPAKKPKSDGVAEAEEAEQPTEYEWDADDLAVATTHVMSQSENLTEAEAEDQLRTIDPDQFFAMFELEQPSRV